MEEMNKKKAVNLEKIRQELDTALTFFDFDKAQKLVQRGLTTSMQVDNKFYQFFFRSQKAILDENPRKAIFYLNKALKINPYDDECYNDKALCLVDMGRSDEALRCVEEGLKTCGEGKLLYHSRGWIFIQMEKYKQAAFNFLKALEFDENYSVCWANLAECLKQEAEFDLALKYYRKALTLIPYKFKDLRKELTEEVERLRKIVDKKR